MKNFLMWLLRRQIAAIKCHFMKMTHPEDKYDRREFFMIKCGQATFGSLLGGFLTWVTLVGLFGIAVAESHSSITMLGAMLSPMYAFGTSVWVIGYALRQDYLKDQQKTIDVLKKEY